MTQLTGITESALHTYACFYKGTLLLAPDAQSLSAYVDALENGDVLDGTSVYEEGVGSLSPYYNFAMMVDMEEMMHQPETYVRLVPNFFFRHSDFFRHDDSCLHIFDDGIQTEYITLDTVVLYSIDKMCFQLFAVSLLEGFSGKLQQFAVEREE